MAILQSNIIVMRKSYSKMCNERLCVCVSKYCKPTLSTFYKFIEKAIEKCPSSYFLVKIYILSRVNFMIICNKFETRLYVI
jgi:hypothetical protein